MKKVSWPKLLMFIFITEASGFISSFLSGDIGLKYAQLNKPPFSPPEMIFGVVWPVLYALMGVAVYLIYRNSNKYRSAHIGFWVQLVLNFFWTILFFKFGLFWAALAVIIALDIVVAYTIYLFGKINKAAMGLMLPYLLWILFATYLNIGFALLN